MLRRLLRQFNDSNFDADASSRIADKILTEFPVFALNEDFLKALSLILQDKMDQVKQMINEQIWQTNTIEPKIVSQGDEEDLLAVQETQFTIPLSTQNDLNERMGHESYDQAMDRSNKFPKSFYVQEAENALTNHKIVDSQQQLNDWYMK